MLLAKNSYAKKIQMTPQKKGVKQLNLGIVTNTTEMVINKAHFGKVNWK